MTGCCNDQQIQLHICIRLLLPSFLSVQWELVWSVLVGWPIQLPLVKLWLLSFLCLLFLFFMVPWWLFHTCMQHRQVLYMSPDPLTGCPLLPCVVCAQMVGDLVWCATIAICLCCHLALELYKNRKSISMTCSNFLWCECWYLRMVTYFGSCLDRM